MRKTRTRNSFRRCRETQRSLRRVCREQETPGPPHAAAQGDPQRSRGPRGAVPRRRAQGCRAGEEGAPGTCSVGAKGDPEVTEQGLSVSKRRPKGSHAATQGNPQEEPRAPWNSASKKGSICIELERRRTRQTQRGCAGRAPEPRQKDPRLSQAGAAQSRPTSKRKCPEGSRR